MKLSKTSDDFKGANLWGRSKIGNRATFALLRFEGSSPFDSTQTYDNQDLSQMTRVFYFAYKHHLR